MISVAFLIRAPGNMVPSCSDLTGQKQGIVTCLGGLGPPGAGTCGRARGPRSSRWQRTWALELDKRV